MNLNYNPWKIKFSSSSSTSLSLSDALSVSLSLLSVSVSLSLSFSLCLSVGRSGAENTFCVEIFMHKISLTHSCLYVYK